MQYRQYKLLNQSEFAEIHKQVVTACDKWTDTWLSAGVALDVKCYSAVEYDFLSALGQKIEWKSLNMGDNKSIFLALPNAVRRKFANHLFPLAQPSQLTLTAPVSALLSELIARMFADALALITEQFNSRPASCETIDANEAMLIDFQKIGSGAVVAEISWGADKFVLVLSPSLVLAGLTQPTAKSLMQRRLTGLTEALTNESLQLSVYIGEAQIELALLQTITVGDVIQLNTRIDEPVQLIGPDGTVVCRGFLGSREGLKSVQLVA